MTFKKPSYYKEKKIVEEVINKCSFCKTNNSVGKTGNFYYCSNNACSVSL
jgi:hypothetical protein